MGKSTSEFRAQPLSNIHCLPSIADSVDRGATNACLWSGRRIVKPEVDPPLGFQARGGSNSSSLAGAEVDEASCGDAADQLISGLAGADEHLNATSARAELHTLRWS